MSNTFEGMPVLTEEVLPSGLVLLDHGTTTSAHYSEELRTYVKNSAFFQILKTVHFNEVGTHGRPGQFTAAWSTRTEPKHFFTSVTGLIDTRDSVVANNSRRERLGSNTDFDRVCQGNVWAVAQYAEREFITSQSEGGDNGTLVEPMPEIVLGSPYNEPGINRIVSLLVDRTIHLDLFQHYPEILQREFGITPEQLA